MSIKVGDKIKVVNSSIFGYAVHQGDVGVVKKITDDIEIEVYFAGIADGLTQWVHYRTWNRWITVLKE